MLKLKSITRWPPHGFQTLHPEFGMKTSYSGDYQEVVSFEYKLRSNNRALAERLGLPIDRASCEAWVQDYTARVCVSGGYLDWVDTGSSAAAEVAPPAEKKTSLLGRVVAVARAVKSGIGVWIEMFGPDGKLVETELAEKRAAVCATCPENDVSGNLRDYFITTVVDDIAKAYEMLRNLKFESTQDAKLGVCKKCICPLRCKVHTKLTHINRHMDAEVRAALPPHCWISTEQ